MKNRRHSTTAHPQLISEYLLLIWTMNANVAFLVPDTSRKRGHSQANSLQGPDHNHQHRRNHSQTLVFNSRQPAPRAPAPSADADDQTAGAQEEKRHGKDTRRPPPYNLAGVLVEEHVREEGGERDGAEDGRRYTGVLSAHDHPPIVTQAFSPTRTQSPTRPLSSVT